MGKVERDVLGELCLELGSYFQTIFHAGTFRFPSTQPVTMASSKCLGY